MSIDKKLTAIETMLSARRPPADVQAVRAKVEAMFAAPWESWPEGIDASTDGPESRSPFAAKVRQQVLTTFGLTADDAPAAPAWRNSTPG